MTALYHDRRKNLQALLAKEGAEVFALSVGDAFFSEYPPDCFKRLEWLTGFDGSAGTVVITPNECAFFTDGRYTLQAAQQLEGQGYTLYNSGEVSALDWLAKHAAESRIAIDPWLISSAQFKRWQAKLPHAEWVFLQQNPVDILWQDRPALSTAPAFEHELRYAGQSREEKLAQIAQAICSHHADALLLTLPESICWLLNLRGRDVANTPLLLCRALVLADGSYTLFADAAKLPKQFSASPQSVEEICATLGGKKVLLDPSHTPLTLADALKEAGAILQESDDPCTLPKACKNAVEVSNIKAAHLVDGAALTRFLFHLSQPQASLTEISAADALESLRRENAEFVEPSFPTISGFGDHGAIVHYRATESTDRVFEGDTLYLVDSGGQYPGGTTDVTRTLAWGTPTAEMKRHYTLVLKGHIALAQAVFPRGTSGRQLDALARQFLWQNGLDYDHGTGHGVGCFLGVHEGPQGISKLGRDAALQPGMILSNEPGYYKAGEYGIRIENLVVVKESAQQQGFLEFETLTCAPLDRRLVEVSLLTPAEIQWWNAYHALVKTQLTPLLPEDCANWLSKECKALVFPLAFFGAAGL